MFDDFIEALGRLNQQVQVEPTPDEWGDLIKLAERTFRAAGVR